VSREGRCPAFLAGADHFRSTSATASISKQDADKGMMHLLGFGSAEVGPRPANEFESKTAAAPGLERSAG
jgi:hypothetical protein